MIPALRSASRFRRSAGAALLIALAFALTNSRTPAQTEQISTDVERAIDRGLAALSGMQDTNGGWSAGRGSKSPAVTGLALMAFMSRGHVPGQGPYGEIMNKGIDCLLSLQQPSGLFGAAGGRDSMYDHGIATIAMCEAFGMLDDRRQGLARTAIAKAVRVILNAQAIAKSANDQGGWRYSENTNQSDLSVSGWQMMALRSAANIGADVPAKAISDGIAYVKRCATPQGWFAYQAGNSTISSALTGTGILSLVLLGQPDAPQVKAGGDRLLIAAVSQNRSNYYYTLYYCSQAAWQLGGKYWTNLNKEISGDLVRRQNANGSWSPVGGAEGQGGEAYATAMAILSLAPPYRYLPLYQR